MMNVLWLVGMLYASQWGLNAPLNNTEKGLLSGGSVGSGPGPGAGGAIGAVTGGDPRTPYRVVTCWNDRVHICGDSVNKVSTLKGSVYLYCGQTNKTISAKGSIMVKAWNREGRTIAEWRIDATSLDKLKRTDLIGVGYSLCLPLDSQCLAEKDLSLTLKYCANDGTSCSDEPARVMLRCDAPAVVQAVHEEQLFLGAGLPMPECADRKIGQQIQLVVLMAQVNPAALKHLKVETENTSNGFQVAVVKNSERVIGSLQTLRSLGLVKIVAQPNIITLTGRAATFQCGAEKPVLIQTSNGPAMSFKNVGVKLDLLPTLTAQGKVRLEVCPGIAATDEKGLSQQIAKVATEMNDGQTLVIFGSGFSTEKGEKQDLVLIVTPHLIRSTHEATVSHNKQTTIAEVVTMSKRGIDEDIILRQLELTESAFNLTTEQILFLHEHGVSRIIIRAMQERRPTQATPIPAPYRIHGGVGPASSGI